MPLQDELHSWANHAYRAWPLLTFGARNRHIFTYEELGEHLGLPSIAVGNALGPVYHYCRSKELPLLNLIVVRKDSGKTENDEFDRYDLSSEQAKVFRHEWFSKDNHAAAIPSVEDFQAFAKPSAAGAAG